MFGAVSSIIAGASLNLLSPIRHKHGYPLAWDLLLFPCVVFKLSLGTYGRGVSCIHIGFRVMCERTCSPCRIQVRAYRVTK